MAQLPINILLVDDEQDFVDMMSLRLRRSGNNVHTAFNALEGLDVLEKTFVDVVILDINMPDMDGIRALKAIKDRHPLTEVILLTGHGAVNTAVEGMKAGAFDYICKPADFDELLTKLEAARQRKNEQEERIRLAEARALIRRTGDV